VHVLRVIKIVTKQRSFIGTKIGLVNTYFCTVCKIILVNTDKVIVRTVSLPNGNKVTSVPLVQAVHTTETQMHLQVLLLKTRYQEHQSNTCADLNVTAMVTVPPCEYTEFCSF